MNLQDLDEYKNLLKPRLKTIVQNEDREWFIVFVLKSVADSTNKLIKRVYSKLEGDFSSKRRERYVSNLLIVTNKSQILITSKVWASPMHHNYVWIGKRH